MEWNWILFQPPKKSTDDMQSKALYWLSGEIEIDDLTSNSNNIASPNKKFDDLTSKYFIAATPLKPKILEHSPDLNISDSSFQMMTEESDPKIRSKLFNFMKDKNPQKVNTKDNEDPEEDNHLLIKYKDKYIKNLAINTPTKSKQFTAPIVRGNPAITGLRTKNKK